jgi:hypothetical protein
MYKLVNGTSYHEQTPEAVCNVLENARASKTRIRIDLGFTDPKTLREGKQLGESWGEIYDVTGYVSRSMGPTKVPILLHNSRSMGGGAMLDHRIVQIKESKGGRVLYQHPTYKPYTG